MSADFAQLDVSALLKPGVYLLGYHSRVTYVGTARCLLMALANQIFRNRARGLSALLPIPRIAFDSIQIIPCDTSRAHELATALIALHDPIHNRPSKPGASVLPSDSQPPTVRPPASSFFSGTVRRL